MVVGRADDEDLNSVEDILEALQRLVAGSVLELSMTVVFFFLLFPLSHTFKFTLYTLFLFTISAHLDYLPSFPHFSFHHLPKTTYS